MNSGPTRRRYCRRVLLCHRRRFVSTENAYVKADKIAISTNVPGRVIEVLISENDNVEARQLLFRLNPEPFQIALNQATAKLDSIKAEIYELQAIYRQKVAELKVQQSDLSYFQTEFDRQVKLKKTRRRLTSPSRRSAPERQQHQTTDPRDPARNIPCAGATGRRSEPASGSTSAGAGSLCRARTRSTPAQLDGNSRPRHRDRHQYFAGTGRVCKEGTPISPSSLRTIFGSRRT